MKESKKIAEEILSIIDDKLSDGYLIDYSNQLFELEKKEDIEGLKELEKELDHYAEAIAAVETLNLEVIE